MPAAKPLSHRLSVQSPLFERQEVGPHAPNAEGATSSSSSSSSSEDGGDSDCETTKAVVAAEHYDSASATASDLAADDSGIHDTVAAAAASPAADPVTSPEGNSVSSDSASPMHVDGDLVPVDHAVAADSTNDKKRKRTENAELGASTEAAGDANDVDSLLPLRLKKLQRLKTAAVVNKAPKPRTESSPSFASPSSMLSPMKDDSKKKRTPRKARVPKKPQSLESRMGATVLSEPQVVELIEELFQEQEQDDRDMYNILTQTVKEQTQCERSDVVEEMDQMEFRRMLTYGEVAVESVSSKILPFLKLQADDVFYDLGCGSGKILIQAMLQTPCAVAKGIELMQNRVQQGNDALNRLLEKSLPVMEGKTVDIVQGDICKPPESAPMMDATVVFINNVCFSPELMLRVTQMLTKMPNLRRVVTLRRFCVRHRAQRCVKARSHCVEYVHPPEEAEISVSWASKTSAYLYERVEYSVQQLTAQLQSSPDREPVSSSQGSA